MLHLTGRERTLAISMTAVVAAWAVYGFAVKPAQDRIRTLERVIPEKQSELAEVRAKSAEYTALREEFESIQARITRQDPAFELLPFLESLIEQHKLAGHVLTMRQDALQPQPGYTETSVTIDLRGVSLRQLVNFLDAVENSGVVAQIGSLHVQKNRSETTLLDSTLQICSPRLTHNAVAAGSLRP